MGVAGLVRQLRLRSVAFACAAFLALIIAGVGGSAGQEPPDQASVSARFSEWDRALGRMGRDVNTLKLDTAQIDALAERAGEVRSQALEFGEQITGFAQEARELRDAFVASTPVGATATPEVQAQGKELEDRVALFDGWIRQVDLTVARADQLLDRISARRLEQLAASLTERGPIPLNPFTWWRAVQEAGAMAQLIATGAEEEVRAWRREGEGSGTVALTVAFTAAVAWLLAFALVRVIERRNWPVLGPTLAGPSTRATLTVMRRALPWIAAVAAADLAAPLRDWLPEASGRAVVTALALAGLTAAICLWILSAAVTHPLPGTPPLINDGARRATITRTFTALIVLFAIDTALQHLTAAFISANLLAVWALVWTVVGGALARSAARVVRQVLADELGISGRVIRLLLLAAAPAVAIVSIVASALGYAQLGIYIFSNSMATAAVFFLFWALRVEAHEIVVRVCTVESVAGRLLGVHLGADQPSLRLAQFWFGIFFDVVVAFGLPVALMIVWGTGTQDALLMVQRIVEGVRVGNITLSLADLLIAILTFAIGVWLTRFAQRILDKRVFPGTQLDVGVRNSVRSGLGYVGVIIAGAIAVLALGINLSNLALVAGALSVGIGFGLQHIINNFVSGLILLIERPVKVGDWITVGGNEGLVNRINVRSTEILTDDRASVLIPNADFLSVSVTNWTLKDRGARLHLEFQLPAALGADAGRDLLLACAKSHRSVLSDPPPRVLLKSISGGYTFELEADVADVMTMREVSSDLRYVVDRELRSRGA